MPYLLEDDDDEDEVTEEPKQTEPAAPTRATDMVQERLLKARSIIISGEINQRLAAGIIGQLLALSAESDEPITLYLNSQGGHVEAGDTIHDMIRFIAAPVNMIGTGWVGSAAMVLGQGPARVPADADALRRSGQGR